MARREGKRLLWMVVRCCRAREVVQSALRQRRVSCRSVSSCSSLHGLSVFMGFNTRVLGMIYLHSTSIIRYNSATMSAMPPLVMKESTHAIVSFLSSWRSLWSFPTSTNCGFCTLRRYEMKSSGIADFGALLINANA